MKREMFKADGISYEIEVCDHRDGYTASWRCQACGRSGGLPYGSPTTAEAVGRAERHLLDEHHAQAHRKG